MAKCKRCSKEFHSCSSCDYTYQWEYKFCSADCYKKYKQYHVSLLSLEYKIPVEVLIDEIIELGIWE